MATRRDEIRVGKAERRTASQDLSSSFTASFVFVVVVVVVVAVGSIRV